MVQEGCKNCLGNARAYLGVDIESDHNLVAAEIRLKLKMVNYRENTY